LPTKSDEKPASKVIDRMTGSRAMSRAVCTMARPRTARRGGALARNRGPYGAFTSQTISGR